MTYNGANTFLLISVVNCVFNCIPHLYTMCPDEDYSNKIEILAVENLMS